MCSGNICRSPMAAEYFRHRAVRSNLSHVVVASAGTLGIEGQPASAEAVEVMHEIGVDLDAHRSRGIDSSAIRTSDLILAASHEHLEEMARRFPDGEGERFLLRAFEKGPTPDGSAPDLHDPIGESIEVYHEVREQIVSCVDQLAIFLRYRR